MPNLTDKQERIIVYKLSDSNPQLFNFRDLAIFILAIVDISMTHDYALGERVVFDWSGIDMGHFPKLDLSMLSNINKLHQEAFSSRVLGLEYINCPPFMDNILTLLKPIFKTKIFNRITLHKDLESLYKNISKKYLPRDYGGEQKWLSELNEEWYEELEVQSEFLKENASMVADETKRIKKLEGNELFGVDGSFKKLNID